MRPLNFLYPLSLIYRLIISLRNFAYNSKIFKIYKVNTKIISIGNITAGGSGKTPFTIFLAKLLQNEGKKITILSRGYGRKSKGWVLVHDGTALQTDIFSGGDEPVMTALELNNIPVAVCEDRVIGAKKLIEQFRPDYIILDDAFQHRRIHRDIDILLLPSNLLKENLMPAGYLREPISNLKRGNIFILTKGDEDKYSKLNISLCSKRILPENPVIINSYIKQQGLYVHQKDSLVSCSSINDEVMGITAIANPEHFYESCQKASIILDETITYPDHHYFTQQNINKWTKTISTKKLSGIIMTMKDYVKFHHLASSIPANIKIYVLKIEISISQKDLEIIKEKLLL